MLVTGGSAQSDYRLQGWTVRRAPQCLT